ncbi:MAG: aspartate/glutamate racemase family protein [Deltaproteobacteria bacterium]|nr:aspartate/glutamate racemase family protein [Deltaproteobacteria bacterium]
MKTIGILGGMSPESTLEYYRLINQEIRARRGGFSSAPLLLYSFDFAIIQKLSAQGAWEELGNLLGEKAKVLEAAGAQGLLIAANTMHLLADDIRKMIKIPLIHIAEVTGQAILASKLDTVGLLGTKFTMEKDFYTGLLKNKFGLKVLVPSELQRQVIHDIIYDELCCGVIKTESKKIFLDIIHDMSSLGGQGFILGCTEIPLLITQEDSPWPLFDTTAIHAKAAADFALS